MMMLGWRTTTTIKNGDIEVNLGFRKLGGMTSAARIAKALRHPGTSVRKLWLHNSNIGDKAVICIAEALKSNSTVQVLGLSGNRIGEEGARAIAEALKTNSALHSIWLSWNNIGDKGATAIAKAFQFNSTLGTIYLTKNNIGADGAKALAQALTNNNSTIEKLDIDGKDIGQDGAMAIAEALKTNPKLRTLYLSYDCITHALKKRIHCLLSVHYKDVRYGGFKVDLSGRRIGDREAEYIARALMDPNTKVKTLDLTWNSIGVDGATAIAEALKSNVTLQTLHLTNNCIEDDGAMAIAEALTYNSTLQTVWLPRNMIGTAGATAIAEALIDKWPKHEILWKFLSNHYFGADRTIAFAKAIKRISALQELNLKNNNIGYGGELAVANAIQTNAALQKVWIGGTCWRRSTSRGWKRHYAENRV